MGLVYRLQCIDGLYLVVDRVLTVYLVLMHGAVFLCGKCVPSCEFKAAYASCSSSLQQCRFYGGGCFMLRRVFGVCLGGVFDVGGGGVML